MTASAVQALSLRLQEADGDLWLNACVYGPPAVDARVERGKGWL